MGIIEIGLVENGEVKRRLSNFQWPSPPYGITFVELENCYRLRAVTRPDGLLREHRIFEYTSQMGTCMDNLPGEITKIVDT